MDILKIQQGNACYLKVTVEAKSLDGTKTPLDLSSLTHIEFRLLRSLRKVPTSLDYTITSATEGVVMVAIPDDLTPAPYVLEFTAKDGTAKIHTEEINLIEIVSTSTDVSAGSGTYEGETTYDIDLSVQIYTGLAVKVDDDVTETSTNPVESQAIYKYLVLKEEEIDETIATANKAITSCDLARTSIQEAADNGEFDGADGKDGCVIFPTVKIDAGGCIVMDIPDSQEDANMEIDEDGYLCVDYPEID